MNDFLGNELQINDIILRVGAESGEFTWSKIIDFKYEIEFGREVQYLGIISANVWKNGTVKLTKRLGWTYPWRCIKIEAPENVKTAFDTI